MVMGSTKDLHGTDEDDENALTMPTLPERNHKTLMTPFYNERPRFFY
jgi:hypothetical protein